MNNAMERIKKLEVQKEFFYRYEDRCPDITGIRLKLITQKIKEIKKEFNIK